MKHAPSIRGMLAALTQVLQAHPRAVLLVCTIIAISAFARAEVQMLASGTPGWWTWFDQGKYLDSVSAFAAGDLAAARHWYPIGYALLALPFAHLFRADPFVIVNVLCLIGSLWAFVQLCETFGISRIIGAAIFLATSVFTHSILLHYVIPWTSTPTAFLILAGLALGFSPPTYTRALLLGLIPGVILLTKPVDAIALAPLAVYYAAECLRARPAGVISNCKHALRLIGMGVVGLSAGLGTVAIAHWLVYGWNLSAYEQETTEATVFIIRSLPIKLYSLFIDPTIVYGHYLAPRGIFSRYPWVFAGACGMMLMMFRDLRLAVLALCVAVYVAMYAAYYDMIPNGLWHYNNIHYFTWCFPIFGLFAFLLARRLLSKSFVSDTVIVIVASVLLIGWRPVLRPIMSTVEFETGTTARIRISNNDVPFVVDLDGDVTNTDQIYDQIYVHQNLKVRWGDRDLVPAHDSRALPTERGVRVLLLTPGNGRSLVISWANVDVTDVRRMMPYKLDWIFL